MNCLKYHKNAKTKYFYDNIFEKGAIPIINRPTRISEHSASLIDNILTTDIFNNSLKKGIIKSDVSDHFPIFFSIRLTKEKLQEGAIKIKKKRVFSKRNITTFKEQLSLLHWRHIDFNGTVNEIYDTFLKRTVSRTGTSTSQSFSNGCWYFLKKRKLPVRTKTLLFVIDIFLLLSFCFLVTL